MDNGVVKILLPVLFELQVTVLNPKLSAHENSKYGGLRNHLGLFIRVKALYATKHKVEFHCIFNSFLIRCSS